MLDHVGIGVSDYSLSKAFYEAALKPLNYSALMEVTEVGPFAGFGENGKPDFWISQGAPAQQLHVALLAKDRATVDAFYKAAMAAGAKDNGPPGLRPSITNIIMARLCWTPTDTTLKPCATHLNRMSAEVPLKPYR